MEMAELAVSKCTHGHRLRSSLGQRPLNLFHSLSSASHLGYTTRLRKAKKQKTENTKET